MGLNGGIHLVAIKILHPQYSGDPDFVKRFQREARAMARLNHDHIVAVFDVEVATEGEKYIVMELVEGKTLKHLLHEKGKLPIINALTLAAQIADALACAHKHGVFHRDIKPVNILLDSLGRAKVADFGIAAAAGESSMTHIGQILGTPKYMSPEQANGEEVTERSDLYSLGMVLYEMLEGKTPYSKLDTMVILGKLANDHEDFDLSFSPETPPSVQEVVKSLLKKKAEDRIASAEIVVSLLREEIERRKSGQTFAPPSQSDETDATQIFSPFSNDAGAPTIISPSLKLEKIRSTTLSKKNTLSKIIPIADTPASVISDPRRKNNILLIGGGIGIFLLISIVYWVMPQQEAVQQVVLPPRDSRTLDEIQTLQKLVRQTQTQIAQAIDEANFVDAKTKSPQTYEAGIKLRDEGIGLLEHAAEKIQEDQPSEAKALLKEAHARFTESLSALKRAQDAARRIQNATPKKPEKTPAPVPQPKPPRQVVQPPPPKPDPLPPQPPPPAPQPPPPPPPVVPARPDIEMVQDLLGKLKRAYEGGNLATINQISQLSPGRQQELQQIFSNYSNIKVTIQNFSFSNKEGSASVLITSLTNKSGDNVEPGKKWRQSSIKIQQDDGKWKIVW
jgi:serine/threonine protein kinase